MSGYIYVVRSGTSNAHKIGYSANPELRLRELQVGSAAKLYLVGVKPGTRGLESAIHHGLRRKRIHGEWFRLTRADVDAVLRPRYSPDEIW